MESIGNTLHNASVAEIVKRARERIYAKRLTSHQEKVVKDIGGILVPSAFQVPNEVVDEGWLSQLNGAEVKVLIYIIRKTFGFNKISGDRIPLSQIMKGTGLSRPTATAAIRALEACELVRIVRGTDKDGGRSVNFYQLMTRHDYNKGK